MARAREGGEQAGAVCLLSPTHRSDVFAFARYVLPLLPLVLLAVACGVRALLERVPETSRALAGPLLGSLLIAGGPLPRTWYWPDDWTANHLAFGMLVKRGSLAANVRHVPDFYLRLRDRPKGSLTLVEAPWFPPIFANALPHYQRLHRQHVRIGFTGGPDSWLGRGELPHPAPGFELESFLFVEDLLGPDPAPADYLVLHRDLRREYDLRTVPVLLEQANEQHEDIGPLVERCRRRFGAPDYEDEWLVVFKLRS